MAEIIKPGEPSTKACLRCGMTIAIAESPSRHARRRFCSRLCRYAAASNSSSHDRIWRRVDKSGGEQACWPFVPVRVAEPYGRISISFNGSKQSAARVIWELTVGKIPPGIFVCHKCDNEECVNPAHLFLGTASDNIRDAIAKGRFVQGGSRLNIYAVRAIRWLVARGRRPRDIASVYGVARRTVSQIAARETWSWVA